MKKLFLIILCTPILCAAQKVGDNTINIKLADTSNPYEQTRKALVRSEFMVKDLGISDTLITYVKDLGGIPGQMIVRAVIAGNTVTINGVYGLKRLDDWGYYKGAKDYKEIIYFKGSKTWAAMVEVVKYLPGEIMYNKMKL